MSKLSNLYLPIHTCITECAKYVIKNKFDCKYYVIQTLKYLSLISKKLYLIKFSTLNQGIKLSGGIGPELAQVQYFNTSTYIWARSQPVQVETGLE